MITHERHSTTMSASTEKLDMVLFGASGFTGMYGVEEAARLSKDNNFTWGVAGRNRTKLEKVLQEASEQTGFNLNNIPIIDADINDFESLVGMAHQSRVVLSYVGPYVTLGKSVVQACIEGGAHLLDLSAEPLYIESVELEYNTAAEHNGVYVISGCGYGFIPSDLGTIFARDKFEGELNSMELYFEYPNVLSTSYHFGTWQSLVEVVGQQRKLRYVRRELHRQPLPKLQPKLKRRSLLHHSSVVNAWCLYYPSPDRSVMMRSQRYFYEKQNKRPLQVRNYYVASSLFMALLTIIAAAFLFGLASFRLGRWLLETFPRFFTAGFISHEGPTRATMKKSSFIITLHGKGWPEKLNDPIESRRHHPKKSITVQVRGTNPGYGATNTFFILSALTLLKENDKLPGKGGVLTTAAAFHNTSLVQELNKNGITFKLVRKT